MFGASQSHLGCLIQQTADMYFQNLSLIYLRASSSCCSMFLLSPTTPAGQCASAAPALSLKVLSSQKGDLGEGIGCFTLRSSRCIQSPFKPSQPLVVMQSLNVVENVATRTWGLWNSEGKHSLIAQQEAQLGGMSHGLYPVRRLYISRFNSKLLGMNSSSSKIPIMLRQAERYDEKLAAMLRVCHFHVSNPNRDPRRN